MARQTLLKSTLCLLMALVCNVMWAQTFVMPETGKYYKIKGDNSQYPWLTGTLNGSSIVVSGSEGDAAVFEKTANGLMVLATGKYLGLNGSTVSLVDTEGTVTIGEHENAAGKYSVKVGNTYMYNNNTDGITHESSSWRTDIPGYWGFIEVEMQTQTYTINYQLKGKQVATTTVVFPVGFDVPEARINNAVPAGYFMQNYTLEGTTYTVNVQTPTSTDGPIVTFTNVQKDGTTTFTLYINENNQLAISNSSAADLGNAAKFRATLLPNGKYTYYNEEKELYMIWKGSSGGHNSNKGVLGEYNATYCDWTMNASANLSGGYYFVSKRGNGTSDGSLVILKGGTFDAYGNSEGWADGHTNVYKIESEEYTATLTDNQGTAITCTTTGFPVPSYSGATLSNPVWADGKLAATVDAQFPALPFPLSSAEVTNPTFISSFKTGGGGSGPGRFKWYALDNADDVVAKRDVAATHSTFKNFSWAIYASLENGAFAYSIKNVAKDKWIFSEASYAANNGSHADEIVVLGATPTKFQLTTDGENRFYYVVNSVNQYISLNSTSTADAQQLGIYAKAHNGTTNSFHALAYDLASKDELVSGGIYAFVTSRGWVGANDGDVAIATVKTSVTPAASTDNVMFQWALYQSNNGNYYLYNLGKQKFLGVPSQDMASIPLADEPMGKRLTFKDIAGATSYPIMFSPNDTHAVSQNANAGLFGWAGGWNRTDDAGSNHKVTYIGELTADQLKTIADLVEAYDKSLPIKVEVEGSWEGNPNTHFGNVTATAGDNVSTTKLTLDHMNVKYMMYSNIGDVVAHARPYRGFEFQGFYTGTKNLGKSFTITEELVSDITAENPLVAKFTATEDVTLFYDDDPFSYRIPAIGKTSTGRLIAVSDYRYSLDDIGRYNFGTANPGIDLVIRMSDDNGKTWGETKTIAKGSCVRNTNDCAYGDAAIAVVGQKVLVMGAAGDVKFGDGSATAHNRTVRIFSEDNGETWTAPQDISETLFIGENATIKNGYTAFFGSGKLAVDEDYNGTGNARIYGAMLIKKEGCDNAIYVIYTDDFGVTWSILGGSQTHITANDEPKVEILPSGQILLSVRRGGGRQFNVFTYSDKATNAGSWNENVNGCGNGGSNTCNGEIYVVDAKKANGDAVKLLLQSQPKGGSGLYDRRDVTIWYKEITNAAYTSSEIAGNWIQGMQVSTQQSSYSTMVLQNDGRIAFFFEEAPCYGDDQAKGYCMVYIPLSIEEITGCSYYSANVDPTESTTVNVSLSDAQGNVYEFTKTSVLNAIATTLTTDYPFIALGNEGNIDFDGTNYTYTNTVTLPFKVSNENTTVWHNIYYPINTNEHNYPVYMSAIENNDVVKISYENAVYGNSSFNTQANSASISWAFYQEGTGLTFKLKNKLNGKYVKTTSAATGSNGGENVQYTENIAEAAAFVPSKEGHSSNYLGEYCLKVGDGFICVWTVSDGRVTYTTNKGHKGAWVKFVEAPDFETLFAEVNATLDMIGSGLGQYTVSETNATTAETAKEAMENSGTVKLNDLNIYKGLLTGATLNKPQVGQYFRIRGISGNYIDASSIYNNANATTGQMSMKSAETCNYTGTIFLLDKDNKLKNYHTGTYIKETREIGADVNEAGVWTFAESPRKGGKYALSCTTTNNNGSHLHDNSGNRADRCSSNCSDRHDFILEEIKPTTVTINASAGFGTLYAPVALAIPDGLEAYVASEIRNNSVTLEPLEGVIPANTGVLLKVTNNSSDVEVTAHHFNLNISEEPTGEKATSLFLGTVAKTLITPENGTTCYVLAAKNGNVGLYRASLNYYSDGNKVSQDAKDGTSFYNNAGKAYLPVENDDADDDPAAEALVMRFGRGQGTTEIELPTANSQQPTAVYDLQGRRVLNPTKGMYIINGKKVVIR